ncbi:Alpha-mannosidase 2C1 [Orchesella cincta]|uniref:Alpha-mannosidase 2C1 n=1 Tax=Orchesella cincta TaxID=48709 RepID=A0A1D2MQ35_ORCCI|nr:Alpha-mannosidase 2C1 [Orchesella cincta]
MNMSSSNAFFDRLEEDKDKLYKWVGELYLELHNGTYTSQARIKAYNRKCEFLLREVELQMAIAYASAKVTEAQKNTDMTTVDTNWQNVLLNQFHDVLPGSCLNLLHKMHGRFMKMFILL